MFYLKHKNEEFAAFKQYKAWAERQLSTKVAAIQTSHAYVSWNLQILSPFQQHILALLPLFRS